MYAIINENTKSNTADNRIDKSHWSHILNSADVSYTCLPVLLTSSYIYPYIVFCKNNIQATWTGIFAYVM